MVDVNCITGDRLISSPPNKAYREQYELIYGEIYIDNSPLARAMRREEAALKEEEKC